MQRYFSGRLLSWPSSITTPCVCTGPNVCSNEWKGICLVDRQDGISDRRRTYSSSPVASPGHRRVPSKPKGIKKLEGTTSRRSSKTSSNTSDAFFRRHRNYGRREEEGPKLYYYREKHGSAVDVPPHVKARIDEDPSYFLGMDGLAETWTRPSVPPSKHPAVQKVLGEILASQSSRARADRYKFDGNLVITLPKKDTSQQSIRQDDVEHCESRNAPLEAVSSKEMHLEEKQHFAFQWMTCPISKGDEKEMASVLVRKGEFGMLDDERIAEIQRVAETNRMSLDQALSLRSTLLEQKAMWTHFQLELKSERMLSLYKEGAGVVDLSKRFDLPPMQVFRTILAKMQWEKSRIKKSLRDPSLFEERERREFEATKAADIVTNVDQSGAIERAEMFEDIVASWFSDRGVRLRRQAEMDEEQTRDHGRAVRTPDVLFLDRVEINGRAVAWMEAKHFYGSGSIAHQWKKMEKQVGKYVEEWGSGAIVYRHGFSKDLCIPSCELLDATALDLSRLEAVGDN